MMRLQHLLPAVAILLLSTVANGQKKGQFLPVDPFVMTQVNYVIDADITAESSLVAATVQVEYRNTTADTLTEIWFQTGYRLISADSAGFDTLGVSEGRCVIDSVSMHGITAGGDSVTFDGNLLKVIMPSRILPGKSGYFQITFKTKLPASTYDENSAIFLPLVNWYPKVCGYVDAPYLTDSVAAMYESRGERADYDLRVNIDTSLSLIFAAHLLNEKHHYGLLSRFVEGTVYEDFISHVGMGIDGLKYEPVFDRPTKPYLLRTTNVTGFPIIVSTRLIRDRIKDDNLAVEICYPPSDRALWGGFVASSACELLKRLEILLGPFPPRHLTIVAGDGDYMGALSDRLLILPRTIDDPDLLYTALGFQLTTCWQLELAGDSTAARPSYEDLVRELLTVRSAADTDEMIDKYNTWCDRHHRAQGR